MSTTLRPARDDDAVRVWEWNFAPDVRAQSIDSRIVTFAEHYAWWCARLTDPRRATWIVEHGGMPIGVVRIDPIEPTPDGPTDKISIALAPEARGCGVGRRAIRLACAAWPRPILAQILSTNLASLAAFAAAGFAPTPDTTAEARVHLYRWSP